MYEDHDALEREWKSKGYKNLGEVNWREEAVHAWNLSTNKESHLIGRCYEFIILHDLKAFVTVDSSD